MKNITQCVTKTANGARKSVIALRISEEERQCVDDICASLGIKASALAYEFFRYSLEAYQQENEPQHHGHE